MSVTATTSFETGGCHGQGLPPRGFTMAEILVVMAIMVILATLAVPALSVITGARSIEAANNLVSASLSRARAEAISRQQTVGLAIYFDAEKQRTALGLVGTAQQWTAGTSYQRGDYVRTEEAAGPCWWLCHTSHTSAIAGTGNVDEMPVTATPRNWTKVTVGSSTDALRYMPSVSQPDTYVTMLPESEVVYLPPGIAAQVLNHGPIDKDRYLHASVIFFGPDGRLDPFRQWGVMFDAADAPMPDVPTPTSIRSSRLGLAIRFNSKFGTPPANRRVKPGISFNMDPDPTQPGMSNVAQLRGGLGVVLFDRSAFTSQHGSAPEWDDQLLNASRGTLPGSPSPDRASELWLDQNGTLLLLNRYTGALLKAD